MSSCKKCKRTFNDSKTSRESRTGLKKRDAEGIPLFESFKSIGVIFKDEEISNNESVCRPCITKLTTIKKAKEFAREWGLNSNVLHD